MKLHYLPPCKLPLDAAYLYVSTVSLWWTPPPLVLSRQLPWPPRCRSRVGNRLRVGQLLWKDPWTGVYRHESLSLCPNCGARWRKGHLGIRDCHEIPLQLFWEGRQVVSNRPIQESSGWSCSRLASDFYVSMVSNPCGLLYVSWHVAFSLFSSMTL